MVGMPRDNLKAFQLCTELHQRSWQSHLKSTWPANCPIPIVGIRNSVRIRQLATPLRKNMSRAARVLQIITLKSGQ
jgi:hypothetical protein